MNVRKSSNFLEEFDREKVQWAVDLVRDLLLELAAIR